MFNKHESTTFCAMIVLNCAAGAATDLQSCDLSLLLSNPAVQAANQAFVEADNTYITSERPSLCLMQGQSVCCCCVGARLATLHKPQRARAGRSSCVAIQPSMNTTHMRLPTNFLSCRGVCHNKHDTAAAAGGQPRRHNLRNRHHRLPSHRRGVGSTHRPSTPGGCRRPAD